ncbi:DUF3667 domain-containing protein [uncultured Bacteroides sp.]|uniref:DUF3667 domain-containing protein n=1 Tax=uncultured Bacteroides sp. TaxID=162156 RepID=UPI002AA898C6|nr:DUF3667 domain-containing protein [uncultured Bacteroides sp.]
MKTNNRTKAYFRLIKRKHRHGKIVPIYTDKEKRTCKNCQHEFEGNFCSNCGQSKNTPRFTYHAIIRNFLGGLTNIDSGFFFTIKELFIRPGYMIRDYIAGRRVLYFRPIQMLFVLATVYVLLIQIIDPTALKSSAIPLDNDSILQFNNHTLGKWVEHSAFAQAVTSMLERWSTGNKALEIILTLPVFALATRWAFRKNKGNQHYNLVELFFVRAYAACQMLVASIVILPFSGDGNENIPWWLHFLFSAWIYAQLFKDKIGKTLKRTALMYIYSLFIVILFAIIAVSLLALLVWVTDLVAGK